MKDSRASQLMAEAIEEIRELVFAPPDSRVAVELIEQVLDRLEVDLADDALERLARSGELTVASSKRKRSVQHDTP